MNPFHTLFRTTTIMAFARAVPVEEELAQLSTFVESRNPSLEEIEKFAP